MSLQQLMSLDCAAESFLSAATWSTANYALSGSVVYRLRVASLYVYPFLSHPTNALDPYLAVYQALTRLRWLARVIEVREYG